MDIKDVVKFAINGYKPAEIAKLKDTGITGDEAAALKAAGYTPEDVFKLLEFVETSPAIKEAAPEKLEENVDKLNSEPEVIPEVKKEEPNVNKESALDKMFD